MIDLKSRILDLMNDRGLSQKEFSEALGISPSSLSSIFNDRTKPTTKHIEAIMSTFPNISPSWLLSGKGEMYLPADDGGKEPEPAPEVGSDGSLFIDFDTPVAAVEPVPKRPRTAVVTEDVPAPEPIIKEVKVVERRVRRITEIRVFYEDQTWETFLPKE